MTIYEEVASGTQHSTGCDGKRKRGPYQVKMYCAWLFLKLTSAGLLRGIPFCSYSMTCI